MNSPALSSTNSPHCPSCDAPFGLTPQMPPPGVTLDQTPAGLVVTLTTRSRLAWFLVPFVLFWCVSSFALIYGSQLLEGRFDFSQSLVGIPFLFGAILFGAVAAMRVAGQIRVTLHAGTCTIFQGIGSFGLTRRCAWRDVSQIVEAETETDSAKPPKHIALIFRPGSRSPLKFGKLLSDDHRYFLLNFLRARLEA